MASSTFAFGGGVVALNPFGQESKVRFVGTWVAGDTWTIKTTSTLQGDITFGAGNIEGQTYSCLFKLRNRMYVGFSGSFACSAVGDVTGWEEQDPGAAVFSFISQFGAQDTVNALASLQGRLVVFGKLSTQIWSVDSDPNQFSLLQTLDNTGAPSTLTVKSIGDYDVMYLDYTGFRSLRAKEVTLNAFVNDIGTPVDLIVRAALVGYDIRNSCAVVEPTTKQYWCYLNTNIYVLSNYPESKVVAWSTYKPTTETAVTPVAGVYTVSIGETYYWTKNAAGVSLTCGTTVLTASGGFVATATSAVEVGTTGSMVLVTATFNPSKFVVYGSQVYCLDTIGRVFQYGGSDNNTYDHCRATVELPWLDLKEPSTMKMGMGLDVAMKGAWTIKAGMSPVTGGLSTVVDRGSATTPSVTDDSTFDRGHYGYSGAGTHFKLQAISGIAATAAKLCKLSFQYSIANKK